MSTNVPIGLILVLSLFMDAWKGWYYGRKELSVYILSRQRRRRSALASWWDKVIGIAHSKDLINWSEQKWLGVMEHEQTAVNCWAPEIFYDTQNNRYMIYWSTTIPGRFPESENSGDCGKDYVLVIETTCKKLWRKVFPGGKKHWHISTRL